MKNKEVIQQLIKSEKRNSKLSKKDAVAFDNENMKNSVRYSNLLVDKDYE